MRIHISLIILLVVSRVFAIENNKSTLVNFEISACNKNCTLQSDIISLNYNNDSLFIEIGVNLVCCGNYQGEFEYTNGVLNLIVRNSPDDKSLVIACDCHCFYNIKFSIAGISSNPGAYLINNKTFLENRNDAGMVEEFQNDSTLISQQTRTFINWYLKSIRERRYKEYQPDFCEDSNGMTKLDYSLYIRNLKQLFFSDSFIIDEVKSYNLCIQNLSKISYTDFIKIKGLDEFEKINCDYSNQYRFIGGQELYNNFKINNITIINKKAIVTCGLCYNDISCSKKMYEKHIKFELQKDNNDWYINRITF